MFSLPGSFGTTPRTIGQVRQLTLDAGLSQSWLRRLPSDGLRVGVVWAGQAGPTQAAFRTLDRRRSAGLAAFAPLAAIPGVRLVSLQTGPAARQPRPAGMTLVDPMPGCAISAASGPGRCAACGNRRVNSSRSG